MLLKTTLIFKNVTLSLHDCDNQQVSHNLTILKYYFTINYYIYIILSCIKFIEGLLNDEIESFTLVSQTCFKVLRHSIQTTALFTSHMISPII